MNENRVLIYVVASHDMNGNPRKGWIVTFRGNLFVDEGFQGRWSLYEAFGLAGDSISAEQRLEFDNSVNEVTLHIPAFEYSLLKRNSKV